MLHHRKYARLIPHASLIVVMVTGSGCGDAELPEVDIASVTPASVSAHFSALPEPPSQHEPTVALGKQLFWDPVLSGNQDVACATCHHPDLGYGDGRPASLGVMATGLGPTRTGGLPVPRNSPTLINVAFNGIDTEGAFSPDQAPMFWDNRVESLENQAADPIHSLAEMRGAQVADTEIESAIVARLQDIAAYRQAFQAAFGEPGISFSRVQRALAAFQRSLAATNSPFDRFMRGERSAMSDTQIRGMQNFIDAGCADCHNGPMFSNYQLHVLSAPDHLENLNAPDTGANDRFEFRTPTLRNLGETAPYMHSGALATLGEVMAFYEDLEEGEVRHPSVPRASLDPLVNNIVGVEDGQAAILAFLVALEDPLVDRTVPASVPSGLPPGGSIN